MALARSASGPGGLSINTGAANLFGSSSTQPPAPASLFGSSTAQPSQPAQSGGLFGAAKSHPPATSLFGSTTTTAQTQQPGGLFGTGTAQTSQPQQNPGLFGPAATTAQPQQTGGLFGSTPASQPQQTGGLFGSSVASQPQQQAGGLFGATPTPQPQQTGGLFGSAANTQAQTTGGLFGSTTAGQPQQAGGMFGSGQQRAAQGGSLFGSSVQQAPASSFGASGSQSIFGAPAPAPGFLGISNPQQQTGSVLGQSLGSGLTMGQSTNQPQQQVVPGVRIDLSNIKGTTRFNDLKEELQAELIKMDNMIQNCMEQKNQVDAFIPAHGDSVEAIPNDVKFVARKSEGTANALGSDAQGIKGLREMVKIDADNARLSFKAVDNLKLPPQYHTSGLWSTRQQETSSNGDGEGSSDLINFFSKTGDEMDEQLKRFERNLGEIEAHMHGVQSNIQERLQGVMFTNGRANGGADGKIAELAAVLRDFEESILKVAGVVGGAREHMTELQLGVLMGNGRNGVR